MNFDSEKNLTVIGKLEQDAKYKRDQDAVIALSEIVADFVKQMPFYGSADIITAVPPREGKEFDLPTRLAQRVAKKLDAKYCPAGKWLGEKGQLKAVPMDAKWDLLEAANFAPNSAQLGGKRVILIDDLYQSGCTLHFVGSKLRLSGAKRIFGLSLVKSWRDTDNM